MKQSGPSKAWLAFEPSFPFLVEELIASGTPRNQATRLANVIRAPLYAVDGTHPPLVRVTDIMNWPNQVLEKLDNMGPVGMKHVMALKAHILKHQTTHFMSPIYPSAMVYREMKFNWGKKHPDDLMKPIVVVPMNDMATYYIELGMQYEAMLNKEKKVS